MAYRVVKCPKGKIAEVIDYGLNKCVICPRSCTERNCSQKNFRLVKKFYTTGLTPQFSVRDDSFDAPTSADTPVAPISVPTAQAAEPVAQAASDNFDDGFGNVFFDDGFGFEQDKSASGLDYSPLDGFDEEEEPAPPPAPTATARTERATGNTPSASAKYTFLRNPHARNPHREINVIDNSTDALWFMLKYWQVDRFLSRSGQELTADGENTVLDYGGSTALKSVIEICTDPAIVDRNEKFFCIYYRVLFPKLQRGLLYYYGGNDYGEISPVCRNADDFFNRIKAGGSLARDLGNMLLPLSVYFGLRDREQLYDYISAEMFSRYGILYVYSPEENAFCNLGRASDFVRGLPTVRDYADTYRKYAALMRIKIRKAGNDYVPENGDGLYGWRKENISNPDDGVYSLLGIQESARRPSVYAMWLCLLYAHSVITDADTMCAGGVVYTKNDIYNTMVRTVKEAFEAGKTAEFFLLRSLLANGVFRKFIERSEALNTQSLVQTITQSDSLEDCYYACGDIDHLLRDGSKVVGISEYVDSLLTGGAGYTAVRARLERDENLRVWINARKKKAAAAFSSRVADLDRLAAECERIFGKRREI